MLIDGIEVETVRWSHDEGLVCPCVSRHSPVPNELHIHHIQPLADGGQDVPSNRMPLCPTGHLANLHELYREVKRYGGLEKVPWKIRQRFSVFIRDLAQEGYLRYLYWKANQ